MLESQIRNEIAKGFKGRLLKGSLTRSTPGGGLDSYGDPVAVTTRSYPCEGIVESFKATFRAIAGIPDTDVKILLIGGLVEVEPQKDDRITFRGVTYQVRQILEIDPANATYVLQGYRA